MTENLIKTTICSKKTNFANLHMNFAVSENFVINMLLFKYEARNNGIYLKENDKNEKGIKEDC